MLNEILNKTSKEQQPLKSKESPYKGKQIRAYVSILIWILITSLCCWSMGGNWIVWLVGLFIAKYVAQFILIFAFGFILYILMYALILGGLFWILIN